MAPLADPVSGLGRPRAVVATGVATGLVVAAFLVLHFGPIAAGEWQAVVGVAVLLGEIGGIASQEQARRVITASVAGGRSELANDSVE